MVLSFGWREQSCGRHTQGISNAPNIQETNVSLAALDSSNIGTVKTSNLR